MNVHPLRPLSASTILWRTPAGLFLTVPVKATFQLSPDAVASRTTPLPLFHDVFFEQNAGRSLYVASDAAPHKPRADVLLTGSAYAPPGQRVPHGWVRLAVVDPTSAHGPAVDKRILVVGERRRDPATGQGTAAAPFARLPIRYELAFGGSTCPDNPIGVGADPGDLRLPSLLDPKAPDAPIGFGPIPGTWPGRRRALGTWDPARLSRPVPELPDTMDWGYFNAAPRDQQIPYLRGDEWIVLEGLHPTAAQVRSRLPGLQARVLVRAPPLTDPAGVELAVRCDTLWIDADTLRCTLTWRGFMAIGEHAVEAVQRGTVMATLALPDAHVAWPPPAPVIRPAPSALVATAPLPEGVRPPASPATPFERPSAPAGQPAVPPAEVAGAREVSGASAVQPAVPPAEVAGAREVSGAVAGQPATPLATVASPPAEIADVRAAREVSGASAGESSVPPATAASPPVTGAAAGQPAAPPAVVADTREFNLQDVLRGLRQEDAPFPIAPVRSPEGAEGTRPAAEIPWESIKQAFPAMAAHIEAFGDAPLPTATLPLPEPEPSKPTSEDLAASPDMPPPARTTENVPILNVTPFAAFTLPWQVRPPRDSLTLVVKGTFTLVPGAPATIAPDQELPAGDLHFDDDPAASLRYPSDFAIFKPKADVLLVGHAVRPKGAEAAALVRLRFGDVLDRAIVAVGPRRWDALGAPTPPEAWERVALRFENAFGGVGFDANPAGTGFGARAGAALPLLEHPDTLIRSPGDKPPPACFAPVPAAWRERLQKIGTYGDRWRKTRWPYFPDDFDWTYFNAAPAQQQIAYPRGDEAFELWSVRPEGEVVRGRLPGVRVRAFAQATEGGGGGFSEIPLRLDTVWFDADALRLVLVWRGLLDVSDEDASEIASLFIVSEPMAKGDATAKSEVPGRGAPMTKSEARARFFAELAAREAADAPQGGEAEAANDNEGEEVASALDAQIAERLAAVRARRRVAGSAAAAAAEAAAGAETAARAGATELKRQELKRLRARRRLRVRRRLRARRRLRWPMRPRGRMQGRPRARTLRRSTWAGREAWRPARARLWKRRLLPATGCSSCFAWASRSRAWI